MNIEGKNAVIEALKNDVKLDRIFLAKDNRDAASKKIIAMAKDRGCLIKYSDKAGLDRLSESSNHQGVIAQTSEYEYADIYKVLTELETVNKKGFLLILDEIEDPHNLGALIRSAEGAGVDAVIIPKRRSAAVNATVTKTSAGAVSHMKVARITNLSQMIEELKQRNYWIYGLDMDGNSYFKTELSGNIALIVGNEGRGLSRLVKEKCDFIVSIPMMGRIQSLNASVAGSIVLFEASKQRSLP